MPMVRELAPAWGGTAETVSMSSGSSVEPDYPDDSERIIMTTDLCANCEERPSVEDAPYCPECLDTRHFTDATSTKPMED